MGIDAIYANGTNATDLVAELQDLLNTVSHALGEKHPQRADEVCALRVVRTTAQGDTSPCHHTEEEPSHGHRIAVHVEAVVWNTKERRVLREAPPITPQQLADALVKKGLTGLGEQFEGWKPLPHVHVDIRGVQGSEGAGEFAPGKSRGKPKCWSVVVERVRRLDGVRLLGGARPEAPTA